MAKIVINIDDKTYKAFMELIAINLGRSNKGIIEKCLNAIKHGNVLPKGHSNLVDTKDLYEHLNKERDDNFALRVDAIVNRVKPIIEADKGD